MVLDTVFYLKGSDLYNIVTLIHKFVSEKLSELILTTVSLFTFGTFDSFLVGLGKNQMYNTYCSTQMAKNYSKPVEQSRKQALRAYRPNIYFNPIFFFQSTGFQHKFPWGMDSQC